MIQPLEEFDRMSPDGSPAHEAMESPEMENQEQAQGDDDYGDAQVLPLEQIAMQGIDLAMVLDDEALGKIANQCVETFDRDKADRAEWEGEYEAVMAMVSGERTPKSFPWPGAANVKYPLIMTAALQFGARAYPAIVRGRDVVKIALNGDDPDGQKRARADRVAAHMNWQLLEDMPEWEEETDKLVHMLPVTGCMFRQVIWDATYSRPKTSLVSAKDLVVSQSAKDLETVPCFAKTFDLFPHEIIERVRTGLYKDQLDKIKWTDEEKTKAEDMLECHCRYDLDEDGYDEPYIAIIHKESRSLLSLKAGFWPKGVERGPDGKVMRVRRHVEFIKYGFVPDFRGRFLDVGFGHLLGEHNKIINTTINQLFDAATDQNAGGGFIGNGTSMKGGALEFQPGEWKMINAPGGSLRENIVPRPTSQPSPVLFELLGIMVEAGKEVASIRDALTGEAKANQPATTTLAIIEQGLQVFSSIYKRIYRALGKELGLIFELNSAYLPDQQYFTVLDNQQAIAKQDYDLEGRDVRPVADPSVTTSAQRLAKAQFLGSFVGDPLLDQREIRRRMLEAAEIEDIEKLLPQPGPQDQMQMAMQMEGAHAEIEEKKQSAFQKNADANKKIAETEKIRMETAIRPIEAAAGVDAQDKQQDLNARKQDGADRKQESDERLREREMGGMAIPPGNGGPQDGLQAPGAIPQIPMGGQPVQPPGGPAVGGLPGPQGQIPGV